MKYLFKRIFVVIALSSLSINLQCHAQNVSQAQRSFKRNAATVIFASLGGGILGLSTLSFYGKPQEHTDNITIGVGLGLIAGLTYILSQSDVPGQEQVKEIWIPEPLIQQKFADINKAENKFQIFSLGITY